MNGAASLVAHGPVTLYVAPLDENGNPSAFTELKIVSIINDHSRIGYGSAPINHRWFNFAAWQARRAGHGSQS